MARPPDRGRSSSSRAGWLFADITLVLAVVFLAASVTRTAGSESEVGSSSTVAESTTTLPDLCTEGGQVKPDPITIEVVGGAGMSAPRLIAALDRKVAGVVDNEPDLALIARDKPLSFGVIILYGGSRGQDTIIGSKAAQAAEDKLSVWSAILPTTYVETGHDSRIVPGNLSFKLFPSLSAIVDPALCGE